MVIEAIAAARSGFDPKRDLTNQMSQAGRQFGAMFLTGIADESRRFTGRFNVAKSGFSVA